MSEITKIEIQKNNKDRVNIFLDGQYAFPLSVETTMKYGLKKGMEIDEKRKTDLIHESDSRVALDKCVHYLNQSLKTKQQIIDYVKKHGFDDSIGEYVIEKLTEYGYIDDHTYAQKYIATYLGSVGKKKIEYDLVRKGVPKDIIESVLQEAETPTDKVVHLVRKKLGKETLDQKQKERIMRYLLGKGFSYDEVKHALSVVAKGEDDESWD